MNTNRSIISVFCGVLVMLLFFNYIFNMSNREINVIHIYILGAIVFFISTIIAFLTLHGQNLKIRVINNKIINAILLVVIVLSEYIVMLSILQYDDGYGNADLSGYFWHIISERIFILFAFVLSLCFVFWLMKIKVNMGNKLIWYVYYLLVAVVAGITSNGINLFAMDVYHVNAYTHPIYNVLHLEPYSELSYGIYGHYELFYYLPLKIFGSSPVILGKMITFLSIIMFFCLFVVVEKIINKFILKVIAPIVLIFPTSCMFSCFQDNPHRLLFPAILLVYIAAIIPQIRKDKYVSIVGFILCTLAILFNTESGTFCAITWVFYNLLINMSDKNRFVKSICKTSIKHLLLFLGEYTSAILICNIYNLFVGGGLFIKAFFYPFINQSFMNHYILNITFAPLPWVVFMILGLSAIVYAITKCLNDYDNCKSAIVIGCTGVILLGELAYFMTRAAYYGQIISYPFAILIALYYANKLDSDSFNLSNMYLSKYLVLFTSTICAFGLVMITIMSTSIFSRTLVDRINNNYYNTDGYSEFDTIKEHVPKDTYAFGWGTDEIYGYLGWNTVYHLLGTTDTLLDREANSKQYDTIVNVIRNEVDSFFTLDTIIKTDDILYGTYVISDQFDFFNRRYYYLTKKDYTDPVKLESNISEDSDIEFDIEDIITTTDNFLVIKGWGYKKYRSITNLDDTYFSLGLLDIANNDTYMISNNAIRRDDVTKAFIDDATNYDYSGLYGRVKIDCLTNDISNYEVVIFELDENRVPIKYYRTGDSL